jgi:hypothetical protein
LRPSAYQAEGKERVYANMRIRSSVAVIGTGIDFILLYGLLLYLVIYFIELYNLYQYKQRCD